MTVPAEGGVHLEVTPLEASPGTDLQVTARGPVGATIQLVRRPEAGPPAVINRASAAAPGRFRLPWDAAPDGSGARWSVDLVKDGRTLHSQPFSVRPGPAPRLPAPLLRVVLQEALRAERRAAPGPLALAPPLDPSGLARWQAGGGGGGGLTLLAWLAVPAVIGALIAIPTLQIHPDGKIALGAGALLFGAFWLVGLLAGARLAARQKSAISAFTFCFDPATLAPGAALTGALSAALGPGEAVAAATVALVSQERWMEEEARAATGRGPASAWVVRSRPGELVSVALPAGGSGAWQAPFSLPLPRALRPSGPAQGWELKVALETTGGATIAQRFAVPLFAWTSAAPREDAR